MGESGSAGRELDVMVDQAVQQGMLDEQFLQLRSLQDESNPDFVKDLIELYYMDASTKLNNLMELLNQQTVDFQQIDAIVHQFKGSSASFGASEMTKMCIEFRDACHQHDVMACKSICGRMEVAYGNLQRTLKEFERLEQLAKSA